MTPQPTSGSPEPLFAKHPGASYGERKELDHAGDPFLLSDLDVGPERLVKKLTVAHPEGLPIAEAVAVIELTKQMEASCAESGWLPEREPTIRKDTANGSRWTLHVVCRKMRTRGDAKAHLTVPALSTSESFKRHANK